jgi:hypothetical protein
MVTALSTFTGLESFRIEFESPRSRPAWEHRRLLSPIHPVLPALTRFWFTGVSEYLEDLLARIDAPRPNSLEIFHFHQLIFNMPQLIQFTVSVAHQISWHSRKHRFNSKTAMQGSVSRIHRNPTQNSVWISYADSRIGSYPVWRRSVIVVPYLSFPRRSTLPSIRVYVGNTTSRMPNGWNYYAHLPL